MDDKIKMIFTEKLNYYLSYRDKTQADLARAMGVTTSTVSDWCNGKKMPRSDRLQAIARWLGIELSDLLTEGEAVQTFEQRMLYDEGVLLRHFDELSESDKQFVRDLVEKLRGGNR